MLLEFLSRLPPDLQLDLLRGERTPKSSPQPQDRAASTATNNAASASNGAAMPIDSGKPQVVCCFKKVSSPPTSPGLTKAALAAHAKALGIPNTSQQEGKSAPSVSSLSVQRSDTPLSIPRTESMSVTEPISVAETAETDVPLEQYVPSDFAYVDETSGRLRLRTWARGEYPPVSHVPGLQGRIDQSETNEMRWSNRLFFFLSPITHEVHDEPHRIQFLRPEEHAPLMKFIKAKIQLIVLNVLACWCPGSAASRIHAADILKMLVALCPLQTFEALRHDSCAYLFQNLMTSCLHVPHATELLLDRGLLLRPDDEAKARDMKVNAMRVRMFYDLCEWKVLPRAAETACSPQVSDDIACAYVHFLRLFVTTMATQPHAELLLQDDIKEITKTLALTACDLSGDKFSMKRRLVIAEALTKIHQCLSTEIVKHSKFIVSEQLALHLAAVRFQTSLHESFCRNRFFSLLPNCLDAFVQTAGELSTAIMGTFVAQHRSSRSMAGNEPLKLLFLSLFQLMVALCTHHFPPKPEVVDTEPDTDVSDAETSAMDVSSDDGNKENGNATQNGTSAPDAASPKRLEKDGHGAPKQTPSQESGEEEIKETKEVIELLVKNTSTTLRLELTKKIPYEVHEVLVKWLVEHRQASIFAANLKKLFDHVADTCPNDAFRVLLEESEVLKIMTSNYKITDVNRTAFHGFVVAFGIMLLELSDPSVAPKAAEPKLDSQSFDELMSQRSESEDLNPGDLDIDMVDALVKANRKSAEGKAAAAATISQAAEARTPEKLREKLHQEEEEKDERTSSPEGKTNESDAGGEKTKSADNSSNRNGEKKPAQKPGGEEEEAALPHAAGAAADAAGARKCDAESVQKQQQPLIPWLADFLKSSQLWQDFLPEIRKQYKRQRTSIYPPLPPQVQHTIEQKRLAEIYGPSVPQFSGIDGMTDLERPPPAELLRRSKELAAAKEAAKQALNKKLDERHEREQRARLQLVTGEITPEAYELLCNLEQEDELDDATMTEDDETFHLWEESGEFWG